MAADGVAFGFALPFGYDFRCRLCLVLLERAGDHHFCLVSAIFAFADLFELLFSHIDLFPCWVWL
jgi:hypothetical protein